MTASTPDRVGRPSDFDGSFKISRSALAGGGMRERSCWPMGAGTGYPLSVVLSPGHRLFV
jgi:hypothetical protein